MKTYLVGGAVRDQLLQIPVIEKDWVVVGSTTEEMLAKKFTAVGKDFPVFLHPITKEEYALARQEKKTGKGYTAFQCISNPTITLEEDLLRRDLTINAIAIDDTGKLIDPYNGVQDIKQKTLRHVSAAFSEDPLRILRVARFAAKLHKLGFSIAKDTRKLMQKMSASGELNHLTPERVWKETEKALATESPHIYFKVLKDCGALAILLPEIDCLFGVPQNATYHPEIDTGIHTLMVVEQASLLSDNLQVRFAALLHDLGKGKTPMREWPRHISHEYLGIPLVKAVCSRLRVPNDYRDLALIVCEQHLNVHRSLELKPSTIEKLFKNIDAYRKPTRLPLFLTACEADAKGRTGMENKPYPQSNYLTACFNAAKKVQLSPNEMEHITGEKIGQLIQEKHIEAIQQVKKAYVI